MRFVGGLLCSLGVGVEDGGLRMGVEGWICECAVVLLDGQGGRFQSLAG